MSKLIILAVLLSSIIATMAMQVGEQETGGARRLQAVRKCTNSYFKSAPGWTPTPGKTYLKCCTGKKTICATYEGTGYSSSYAACMTRSACKKLNGGKLYKKGGWNCKPIDSNPFPQCQNYYACKKMNGGKLCKKGGWNCKPIDNPPFPQCQIYFGM